MEKAQVLKLYYFSPIAAAKFGYVFAKNKRLEDVFYTEISNFIFKLMIETIIVKVQSLKHQKCE